MIKSYRNKKTQQFAAGERVREFEGFRHQAEKRLEILDAAPSLETLRNLRSNRFEVLRGDRVGQYSIRINRQCADLLYLAGGTRRPIQHRDR